MSIFNENSRVKIPALLHFTRLGCQYLSLKDARWDTRHNIFPDILLPSLARIKPGEDAADLRRLLDDMHLDLQNEDLGKAFHKRLTARSGLRLIDFDELAPRLAHSLRLSLLSANSAKKIAAVLSALDAKIDLNIRINAELEALAKTIYDYWFVQFDFPDANGRPYKSSGGKMVWNEVLKREIPAGWQDNNITVVAEVLGGATPSKGNPDHWNGEIPFFTPTDASGNVFQLQTEDAITDLGLGSCSSDLFDKGTIFITARGSVGKIAIAGRSMAMDQSCYAFVPKIAGNYPYVFLHSKTLIHHLKVKASGSTFNSIVTNDIEWTRLVSPESEVVSAFCKVVAPLFGRIETAQRECLELTQLRDWLLPLLMNGQVRVA